MSRDAAGSNISKDIGRGEVWKFLTSPLRPRRNPTSRRDSPVEGLPFAPAIGAVHAALQLKG
jgi:hypothetical protein